ncbi:MAG: NfeD family protein [Oscillospiraceae bacterium]|nr:NfeD family protein [Oscillospiraceae bacterium]
MLFVWLIIFGIFLVIELLTLGLTTIWFAGGSLIALVASAAGGGYMIQIILFLAVSVVLLYLVRPAAQKKFNAKRVATNVDSLLGKKAIVEEAIDNLAGKGRVKLGDVSWAARSVDEKPIEKGSVVVIESVEGVKLMVHRESEQTE